MAIHLQIRVIEFSISRLAEDGRKRINIVKHDTKKIIPSPSSSANGETECKRREKRKSKYPVWEIIYLFYLLHLFVYILYIIQPGPQPHKQDSRSILCFVLSISFSSWMGGWGVGGGGEGNKTKKKLCCMYLHLYFRRRYSTNLQKNYQAV